MHFYLNKYSNYWASSYYSVLQINAAIFIWLCVQLLWINVITYDKQNLDNSCMHTNLGAVQVHVLLVCYWNCVTTAALVFEGKKWCHLHSNLSWLHSTDVRAFYILRVAHGMCFLNIPIVGDSLWTMELYNFEVNSLCKIQLHFLLNNYNRKCSVIFSNLICPCCYK